MNIEIDGKEYEVLPLDADQNAITHARLASGVIVNTYWHIGTMEKFCNYRQGIGISCWKDLGIQPLQILPKAPVEFVVNGDDAVFVETHTVDNHGHESSRGFWALPIPSSVKPKGKKFRCVEVTERAT